MTHTSYLGWWYATGPTDRPFQPKDRDFAIHRVVSDTSATPGCVTVENPAGQQFPLAVSLLVDIAAPPGQVWDPATKAFASLA